MGSEHPEKVLRMNLLCLVFAGWSFFWRSTLKLLVLSFTMSGTTKAQAYDARVYTVCAPWAGGRGDSFIRVFQPEFLNGLDSISDDWSTMRAHAEDRDMGGDPQLGGVAIGPPLAANEQRASDKRAGHDQIVPTS